MTCSVDTQTGADAFTSHIPLTYVRQQVTFDRIVLHARASSTLILRPIRAHAFHYCISSMYLLCTLRQHVRRQRIPRRTVQHSCTQAPYENGHILRQPFFSRIFHQLHFEQIAKILIASSMHCVLAPNMCSSNIDPDHACAHKCVIVKWVRIAVV